LRDLSIFDSLIFVFTLLSSFLVMGQQGGNLKGGFDMVLRGMSITRQPEIPGVCFNGIKSLVLLLLMAAVLFFSDTVIATMSLLYFSLDASVPDPSPNPL